MAKDFLSGIEALRKKPVEVRNRYAFGIAFVCTFIILAMWGLSLPSRVASTVSETQESELKENVFEDFSAALGGYRDRFTEVVTSFADRYRDQSYESATSSQGGPVFDLDLEALISSSTTQTSTATPPVATTTPSPQTGTSSTTTVETEDPQIP